MQETELPAWSKAGRRDGDRSSLMWCLRLERQVRPHLGGQGGLSTHSCPKSAPSGFKAAMLLQPELLTLSTAMLLCILSPKFCKTPNVAIEAPSRSTQGVPLQSSFPGFVTHQPSFLGVPCDSVSLCWRSMAPPLTNEEPNGLAACPTPKEQPDPGCRCVLDASPRSIFGPASIFSCDEQPLADDRSPRSGCRLGHGGYLQVCLQG